ncbi:glycoside hydrolase family 6 protein [Microbacterium ulmi]|uniref:Glucanase n=1 Tax=Microbacterium ulmi TaxID=179095 RepID=A0A7Y2M167_9MICO|nr:glycoside hydrolase family 6 protein [Microbacterium ulmi]NII69031.1 endoglucanase [Microbacterium ulmi]NNH04611.1 glycoside hydrolase family 6 [Microbacterium ulmi]
MFPRPRRSRALRCTAVAAAALIATAVVVPLAASAAAADSSGLAGSGLYVNPLNTTLEAAQGLSGQSRSDAQLLGSIPSADWFTKGTPAEVRAAVDGVVTAAAKAGRMPVLVAYNLPFRDCAQYSAGGAENTAAYAAWIDAFAAGIGARPATVILEPDGLGIIPHYTSLDGSKDWCQPVELDPATATADRFAQLNHAVDALAALPAASVYLDGVHSGWLNVGEISDRLLKGGVQKADGFFLNASNYQFTANLTAYGRWISSCIAFVTEVPSGSFAECGNQYWNGGPANNWSGVAMSNYGQWSAGDPDPALNTDGVDSRYASQLGAVAASTRYVIDTSRNGQGPWQAAPDQEDWCNPPGRGLGAVPTTNTGVPLVDAYLWIKVPGESDGTCYRGTAGPLDPVRGIEDPAAGQWFAVQARELVALASPAVAPLACDVRVIGTKLGSGFAAAVTVENRGTATLSPWTLAWTFGGTQRVRTVVGGSFAQAGPDVTVTGPRLLGKLAPGKKTAFVVTGRGAAEAPWQFRLNGQACTSH